METILSFVAIPGAAVAALACDYLRAKGAGLLPKLGFKTANPTASTALVKRPVQLLPKPAPEPAWTPSQKRLALAAPAAPTPADVAPVKPSVPQVETPLEPLPARRVRARLPAPEQPEQPVAAAPAVPQDEMQLRPRRVRRRLESGDSQPKDDDMNSKEALSNWLIQKAVARAEAMARGEIAPGMKRPRAEARPEPQPEVAPAEATQMAQPRPVQTAQAQSKYEFEPVVVDENVWKSLFSSSETRQQPVFELIQGSGGWQARKETEPEITIPAGFHKASALKAVTEDSRLFTGLVMSIGVARASEYDEAEFDYEKAFLAAEEFIRSQMRQSDFGCAVNGDEFLLISPGQTGIEAQRRLSGLSERLWDYQLKTLSNAALLFSLGAVDVQREPLNDAIASAKERMLQTRRSRQNILMYKARKKAV